MAMGDRGPTKVEALRKRVRINLAEARHAGVTVEELMVDIVTGLRGSGVLRNSGDLDVAEDLADTYRRLAHEGG